MDAEHETQRLQEICDRLEDELRQKQKPSLVTKGRKRSISDLRDVNKVRIPDNLLYYLMVWCITCSQAK